MTKLPFLALALLGAWMLFSLTFVTLAMGLASLSFFLLCCGFLNRKRRQVHAPLMLTAIVIDLGLVLTLEIKRHAVETAFAFRLNGLQQAHIAFSTLAVALYLPMLAMGLNALCRPGTAPRATALHRKLGPYAFLFRSLGYLLMFSMLHSS